MTEDQEIPYGDLYDFFVIPSHNLPALKNLIGDKILDIEFIEYLDDFSTERAIEIYQSSIQERGILREDVLLYYPEVITFKFNTNQYALVYFNDRALSLVIVIPPIEKQPLFQEYLRNDTPYDSLKLSEGTTPTQRELQPFLNREIIGIDIANLKEHIDWGFPNERGLVFSFAGLNRKLLISGGGYIYGPDMGIGIWEDLPPKERAKLVVTSIHKYPPWPDEVRY